MAINLYYVFAKSVGGTWVAPSMQTLRRHLETEHRLYRREIVPLGTKKDFMNKRFDDRLLKEEIGLTRKQLAKIKTNKVKLVSKDKKEN